jgi:hypothetical protein
MSGAKPTRPSGRARASPCRGPLGHVPRTGRGSLLDAERLPAPVDRDRVGHLRPVRSSLRRLRYGPCPHARNGQRERRCVRADAEGSIGSVGRYERRVNAASTPSRWTTGAVAGRACAGASRRRRVASRPSTGQAHHVRADRRVARGTPGDLVGPARASPASTRRRCRCRSPSASRRARPPRDGRARSAPSRRRARRPGRDRDVHRRSPAKRSFEPRTVSASACGLFVSRASASPGGSRGGRPRARRATEPLRVDASSTVGC